MNAIELLALLLVKCMKHEGPVIGGHAVILDIKSQVSFQISGSDLLAALALVKTGDYT